MTFSLVPEELKTHPNWVVWKYETRHGKETKVPYDAKTDGANAKANDAATWAPFKCAFDAADILSGNDYDGIGFELHGTDLVGVDFDGVLHDGQAEPYVLEILKHLGNPYCEITPSGNGLRAFVRSTLPTGGRKFTANKYGCEIYSGSEGGRYLTVTGNRFSGDGIPTIADIGLPYFLVTQINNVKFKKLWIGDTSDFQNDDSRADFALCRILARLLKNDARKIEAYFSASQLAQREKWNRPDYRKRTIAAAIAGKNPPPSGDDDAPEAATTEATASSIPHTEIWSAYASEIVPVPITFLWEPYLQTNALNAFYGNPGVGKGFTAMDVIARLTAGRPFPTESSTDRQPMNCAVLAAEEGVADTLVPRLMAAGADRSRVRILRSKRYHDENDKIEDRLITFQTDMVLLKADLQRHPEERFLLVDPITNYVGDINFNQDGEVRPVLTQLVQLAEEFGITIHIVGHFNKNTNVGSALDKPGGARAWTAVPRTVWGFFRNVENRQQRMMANLKINNGKDFNTGLVFTIGDRVIGTKPDGKPWNVGYVEWGGRTEATADDMVTSERPEVRRDSKGVDFLTKALNGGIRKATEVYDESEGVCEERTLKSACKTIGVLKFKMADGWFWQHPSDQTPIPESAKELNTAARARRERQESAPPPEPQDDGDGDPAFEFGSTEVQVG